MGKPQNKIKRWWNHWKGLVLLSSLLESAPQAVTPKTTEAAGPVVVRELPALSMVGMCSAKDGDRVPHPAQGHWGRLPRTCSSWVFSVSKWYHTVSDNLFQCLTTLAVKKFLFHSNGIVHISIYAYCLLSCPWTALRRIWFHLLYAPH